MDLKLQKVCELTNENFYSMAVADKKKVLKFLLYNMCSDEFISKLLIELLAVYYKTTANKAAKTGRVFKQKVPTSFVFPVLTEDEHASDPENECEIFNEPDVSEIEDEIEIEEIDEDEIGDEIGDEEIEEDEIGDDDEIENDDDIENGDESEE